MTILNIRKIEDQINKIFNHILKENKIQRLFYRHKIKETFIKISDQLEYWDNYDKLVKIQLIFKIQQLKLYLKKSSIQMTIDNQHVWILFLLIFQLDQNVIQQIIKQTYINFRIKQQYYCWKPFQQTILMLNNYDCKIDIRQRDGLILIEPSNIREHNRNPEKYIIIGYGITLEKGGGPFILIHYFSQEYCSEDVNFNFLNGFSQFNFSDNLQPTYENMYLLFEQNYIFQVPQRVVQKTKECNILYLNNKVVNQGRIIQFYIKQGDCQTLSIQNKQSSIVQIYSNSYICSLKIQGQLIWIEFLEH
ncbi:unnamed protein product [Paramecium primaurelia]|uniref:Uncharacterized protein n=1 Tax=Paramecium primaurelia TaxID=5886 RepID=A0A8S1NXS5_PARPR|nr:unnamed protein product [Paramecium primaurelia]